jgi:hypothetical protein
VTASEPRRGQGLEIAVSRVGRQGARARWAAIAWAGVLVALVTVAIAERPDSAPSHDAVAVNVARPHADPGPLPSAVVRVARMSAPPVRLMGEDGAMGPLGLDRQPRRVTIPSSPAGGLLL